MIFRCSPLDYNSNRKKSLNFLVFGLDSKLGEPAEKRVLGE